MKFPHYNQLGSCAFLLQFAIFIFGLYASDSVTYFGSQQNEECEGTEVKVKCENKGGRSARIQNAGSLDLVKTTIPDSKEYWTGLSWHKKTFYWDDKEAFDNGSNITAIADKPGSDTDDKKYCFLFKRDRDKLEMKSCQEQKNYLCEKESASATVSSTGLNKPSFASGISGDTFMPSSTLKTSMVNEEKSLTLAKAATEPTLSTSELLTLSSKTNLSPSTVLQSSILTTDLEMVDQTLSTGPFESSIAIASSSYGPSQGENTAKVERRRYTAKLKALNVSRKGSLQNATSTADIFFKALRKEHVQTKDTNVLLATRDLESFAINYGKIHYKANESKVISKENYAMMIKRIPTNRKDAVVFSVNDTEYAAKTGWASISVPLGAFQGKDVVVVCIIYNDIKQWVPDEKHVELDGKTLTNLELRSRIIAGRVDPAPVGVLEENVTILFSYDKGSKEEATPHCVFWNFSIKSELNGSWSSKGCSLVKIVNNEITCSCNHLTNFAVLMQVGENKGVSIGHTVVLQVITYVGCALSLTGEVLTSITYCVLMDLKQEQIQIRLNLVVAIAIAQITFLAGIDATETTDVCVFVAALIHYFYLVGFAWMLVEGIYLYLMVVKVFNTEVKIWRFYAASWGIPVLIVVLSIVIPISQDGGVHNYVHSDFCWVSFTNNLVWTFATPVLVVCLVNAVILACVIREIIKMQSAKTSDLERIRQGAKASVVLFPLLGMTWVFGILSVTDAGLVFQYVFTILNSLQGFFIFILHVLKNSDVRAEFDRKKQKWKTLRSVGTSHETHQPSRDISTNKAMNSDTYELDNRQKEAAYLPEIDDDCPAVLRQQENITPVDT